MGPLIGIASHQAPVALGEFQPVHEVVSVAFVKSVRKAGGMPLLVPLIDPDDAGTMLDRIDGLVLTGGADVDPASYGAEREPMTVLTDPARDARDMSLARLAVERDIPTIAICRGCQVLNVALGGTLVQHVDGHMDAARYRDTVHDVKIAEDSRLAQWVGAPTIGTNTLHHQAVQTTGPDMLVVAHAPDGTIEGIEAVGSRAVGVQWHPEYMRHRPEHLALFAALVEAAAT